MSIYDIFAKKPAHPYPPGVYPDMSRGAYDHIPALSSTVIKKWIRLQSIPSVFEHWNKNRWDEEPTEALLIGSALDTLRLEPHEFEHRFTSVPPDAPRRPSAAQRSAKKPSPETLGAIAWWTKFNEQAAHKQILTSEQIATVRSMDRALRDAKTAEGIFENCRKVVLVGEVFGQPAKAELDLWNPNSSHILDVKTAQDVTESGFIRAIDKFQYVEQAVWYLILAQNLGFKKTNFDWVAVGSEEPWPVKVHPFATNHPKHDPICRAACHQIQDAVETLASACQDGRFEDDPDWHLIDFPEWYVNRARKQLEMA